MHISYNEMLTTPISVIFNDLRNIDIENRLKNERSKK